MTPDTADTIVAIASARGTGQRGIVRLTGPRSLAVVKALGAVAPGEMRTARRFANRSVRIEVGGAMRSVPLDVLVWPDGRSYTGQPSAELHTVGSPSVLEALVRACLANGARLAEPGEYTLRALLAGRIDLLQAEAVLSVIDATDSDRLAAALERLAGGASGPLHRLRAELLDLLADLEAGLDFVEEEGVRFVEPPEVTRRLDAAGRSVAAALRQVTTRDDARRLPRVALVGSPNVGKSRLFNALTARYGNGDASPAALVADTPGVTRDALSAELVIDGLRCELIDTAGDDASAAIDAIDAAARERLDAVRRDAEMLVACAPLDAVAGPPPETLAVATMADRFEGDPPPGWIVTSAVTGQGLDRLAEALRDRLATAASDAAAFTADHARNGLIAARDALARASNLATAEAGDELISLELRAALDALGRVVGEVLTDEVLGQVFGKFCIGK